MTFLFTIPDFKYWYTSRKREKNNSLLTTAFFGILLSLASVESIASIDGVWVRGDGIEGSTEIIAFTPDGFYLYLSNLDQTIDSQTGIEEGTYSWDSEAGTLSTTILVDGNGSKGFSGAVEDGGINRFIPGENQATLTIGNSEEFVANKIEGQNTSIQGAWVGEFEEETDVFVVFFDNNSFISASQFGQDEEPTEEDDIPGVEKGSYIWDEQSGSLELVIDIDTNPLNGFSNLPEGSLFLSFISETGTLEVVVEGEGVISNLVSADDAFSSENDDDSEGGNSDWIAVET